VVNFHLKLNINEKPIDHKYREGKLKKTLKRESKESEAVESESFTVSICLISPWFLLGVVSFLFCLEEGGLISSFFWSRREGSYTETG